MASSEKLILDPSEVSASGRTALDITPWLRTEGADYGDATIAAVMADRDRGSIPVDFSIPNREIHLPLRFSQTFGGTTTATARANIQAKIALFQKEGGWLKRITNNGGTVYADVVDASTLGMTSVSGWESDQGIDLDSSLSLTCLPDFYQDEITLGSHTENTAAEINFTETGIQGDYPARCRVVVTEAQAADQRGMIVAFRSQHYASASTAALKFEAESLGVLDTAAKAALSGASGGTVITHGTLSTNWTPVMSTNVAGTQFMTHQGTYRLYARVYSTSGTTVQARCVWDVGDLVNPVENDAWRLPGASNFYVHDFGELRLDAPPVGTYRWQGQIQAKGDVGSENFSVDKVWLVPVDEGMAVLTAPFPTTQGLATYSARDEFNQTAGTITGKVLPVGGTWAGAGNAADFSVAAGIATRTAVSDTGPLNSGRLITASTPTLTNASVRVDLKTSLATANTQFYQGVLFRYTDTSNFGLAVFNGNAVVVWKQVAGVSTPLFGYASAASLVPTSFYTLQVAALADGKVAIWYSPQGGAFGTPVVVGQDAVFAAGGALASGKVGIFDMNTGATAATRTYDNFAAWVPSSDAVNFASRTAQLTTDGNFRLDSGGTAYGPVSYSGGDLLRLPVAGLEGRTTECLIKSSRGDFDQMPDTHTSTDYGDDGSAQIFYRPCYLNTGTI